MANYDKDTAVRPRLPDRVTDMKRECNRVDKDMNNKRIPAYEFEGKTFISSTALKGYT